MAITTPVEDVEVIVITDFWCFENGNWGTFKANPFPNMDWWLVKDVAINGLVEVGGGGEGGGEVGVGNEVGRGGEVVIVVAIVVSGDILLK